MNSPARIAAFCAIMLSASLAQAQYSYTSFVNATNTFNSTSFSPNTPTTTVKIDRSTAGGQASTYGSTLGGEFVIQWDGTTDGSGTFGSIDYGFNNLGLPWETVYKTFCIEKNENVSMGSTYLATIDDKAYYDKDAVSDRGTNTTGDDASLTVESQLLYGLYFEGRLDNAISSFSYQDDAWADALQNAIWHLEGYDPPSVPATSKIATLLDWAADSGNQTGAFGFASLQGQVKVLNLWDPTKASAAQSQLIYDPAGGSGPPQGPFVPEPATATIWAAGLAACGYRQYRRSRGKNRTA